MIDEVKKEGDMVNEERFMEFIFSLFIVFCEIIIFIMIVIMVKIYNLMFLYF